ncbi:deoxyguanosinetriphosphate triphosphohydrolase [Roseomonas terrae]|jgi:dGTPase|uniref:Deoxyguanosinetriphosphate triphosphohydrolase-like protein n=1 Tax=Neoroseomonas terrae TaxID=424799 RepID=A0ABS5EEN5_9PROT|nr:deoxyguanosinetriphosphate triphosphohydrolase [Neoroseomonas terrae]MBR0649476.1 deoxyguanosinetriphosphate triphosphohydrolase [Neoroseomonas terrae]
MALAPHAVRPETSRGRLHPEAGGDTRSPFQRDRDRIIHATSFRRLQYKTQVFVYHEGDHFRTRLTHSIEVAQIARSIARLLWLDEDLAEALALAHDLGHPPFGHAGEDALNSAMKPYGGFDHNAQSLKAVTQLETRYAGFDGLNLTWETLEGLAKHNGPLRRPAPYIADYDAMHPLDLGTHASAEAQVAALADDIAYNNHDLDDGLRARLFTLEEVAALPLVGEALANARAAMPDMPPERAAPEMIRRVINMMVLDVVAETRRRVALLAPTTVDDIRRAGGPVVAFSTAMAEANLALRDFLFTRMYRHWRVNRTMAKSKRVVQLLFSLLHGGPQMLPPAWRGRAGDAGSPRCALVVCDYIAGMTDRYALEEHRRMTDPDVPG